MFILLSYGFESWSGISQAVLFGVSFRIARRWWVGLESSKAHLSASLNTQTRRASFSSLSPSLSVSLLCPHLPLSPPFPSPNPPPPPLPLSFLCGFSTVVASGYLDFLPSITASIECPQKRNHQRLSLSNLTFHWRRQTPTPGRKNIRQFLDLL